MHDPAGCSPHIRAARIYPCISLEVRSCFQAVHFLQDLITYRAKHVTISSNSV